MQIYNVFINDFDKFSKVLKKKQSGARGPKQKKLLDYGNDLKKVIEKSFNPPESELKILTPQQMLARLPSIYYTWKNVKSDYNNNKFKISAPTWNDTFDVPDGSYSIAALQNYFEYITKKHETFTEVSPVLIYVNEINNRIVFKIR